jgi:hypothetical protein
VMTDPTMPTKSPKREEQAEVGMRFTVRVLKDRMRRPEGRGGEWEPIKNSRGNLAYVPNQTQRASLLTRSRARSYWKATSPQTWVRNLESKRKHNKM